MDYPCDSSGQWDIMNGMAKSPKIYKAATYYRDIALDLARIAQRGGGWGGGCGGGMLGLLATSKNMILYLSF